MTVVDAKKRFEQKRVVCGACSQILKKGELFANVNMPDGTTATVHARCMSTTKKSDD